MLDHLLAVGNGSIEAAQCQVNGRTPLDNADLCDSFVNRR
jgi:hypothetical protein